MDQDRQAILALQPTIDLLLPVIAPMEVAPAILFVGPIGTGKRTYGRHLIQTVSGTYESTDVLELKGTEKVQEFREQVTEFTSHYPAELEYRWLFIHNLDWYSWQILNSVLKTLEEPPPWIRILATAEETRFLPPAIKSRFMCYSFRSLDRESIAQILDLDFKTRPLTLVLDRYPFRSVWEVMVYRTLDFEGHYEVLCGEKAKSLADVTQAYARLQKVFEGSEYREADLWEFFLRSVIYRVNQSVNLPYKRSLQILFQTCSETLFRYIKHPNKSFLLTKQQIPAFFTLMHSLKGSQ